MSKDGQRRTEYIPLDAVVPADKNPKGHAESDIQASINRFGYTTPILMDERTGKLVEGHGRLDALRAKREAGEKPPSPGGSWVVWDKRDNDSGMDLDKLLGAAFELCWSKKKHKREIARVLWSMTHGQQRDNEDAKRGLHPTQKPVALVEWFMERWGTVGDNVLDLFGGSGTTLIGCEGTGRNAYVMELDPQYVDVIARRFQEHTGIKPVLESTGEPVDFTQPKESNDG